jgi:hypothetical protein
MASPPPPAHDLSPSSSLDPAFSKSEKKKGSKDPDVQVSEKVRHSGTTSSDTTVSTNGPNPEYDQDDETLSYSSRPPSLNFTLRTPGRERYIIIFFMLLFIESGILPLILFYSLQWGAHLSVTKNLAIITSLIGTVSGLKITHRTYQLWFRSGHESRRPIGSGRWGVDTFQ